MVSGNAKTFRLKGSLFTLTVLQLLDIELSAFEIQLAQTVSEAPNFFCYAPIIIDLQCLAPEKAIKVEDFKEILSLLRRHQLIPVGMCGGSEATQRAAQQAGLAMFSHKTLESSHQETTTTDQPTQSAQPTQTSKATKSLVITDPIRSGQQIYAQGSDLIVLSQVSRGAELLADGNIHIYGTLKGRALAGITGSTDAKIFAQAMDAELISIAGFYIIADALKQYNNKPLQMFYLDNEVLLAQEI